MDALWWKRDPDTGKMIVSGETYDTTFFPITTAVFTKDWSIEGRWTANQVSHFNYVVFSYTYVKARNLAIRKCWRME